MRISVADAAGRLIDLAKRAEQGEEVILTKNGEPAIQLVPIARQALPSDERWKVFAEIRKNGAEWSPDFETDAARSQDFLYDEFGLPK